jgi:hypothetical protein
LQLSDEEELRDALALSLWPNAGNVEIWRKRALLGVSRPLHPSGKTEHVNPNAMSFLYHRALGFIELPVWLEKLRLL